MIEVVLLGAAQDGGYPQFGCNCDNCERVYLGEVSPDLPASVAIIDHNLKKWWIIDPTLEIKAQWLEFSNILRAFSFSGVFITHCHAGHYPGILYLGKESLFTSNMPVYCSEKMFLFLNQNQPWKVLIDNENVKINIIHPFQSVLLSDNIKITPIPVIHRAEFTDTFAFGIKGEHKEMLYCPDIDSWKAEVSGLPGGWLHNILCKRVYDILLLDATFYDDYELPNRDMKLVPHPRVVETVDIYTKFISTTQGTSVGSDEYCIECLSVLPEFVLIHMNHTNRLWVDVPLVEEMKRNHIKIGRKGQKWQL